MQKRNSSISKQHALRIVSHFFRHPKQARKAIQHKYHHPESTAFKKVFDSISIITGQDAIMPITKAESVFTYWQARPLLKWFQLEYSIAVLMLTGKWCPPLSTPPLEGQSYMPDSTSHR